MLGKCLSLENLIFLCFTYRGRWGLFLSLRLIQSVLDFFVTFFIKEKSKENLKHERWPLQPHLRITQRLAISSDREHKTLIGTNQSFMLTIRGNGQALSNAQVRLQRPPFVL